MTTNIDTHDNNVFTISARTDKETGELVLFGTGDDSIPMTKEWFYKLSGMLGPQLVGVNVMHTNFSTMSQTLKFVREECGWGGPLGAYVLQCYVTV